jgi:hypothetical protein
MILIKNVLVSYLGTAQCAYNVDVDLINSSRAIALLLE